MSYKNYKKYIHSKTHLIDKIPAHWDFVPMNKFITLVTDYVANGSFKSLRQNVKYLDEENYAILVRLADNTNNFSGPFVYISKDSYDFLSKSKLYEGDIVLCNVGAVGSIFKVPNLGKPMSLAPNSLLIRFGNPILANYFYYFFSSDIGQQFINSITNTTTQPKFNKTDFRKLLMLNPPLTEQESIVKFLDKKVLEIDANISKNKELISLLEEKKTALINQVVTKGLDSNVPMKNSGIEWIGEIPEHWEIKRLKFNCKVNPSNKKHVSNQDIKINFLPMEKVSEDGWYDAESKEEYSKISRGYTYFEDDDVLSAKITPCFENGKSTLVKDLDFGFGFGSTEFHVIRFSKYAIPEFIFYLLNTHSFRNIGQAFMTGTAGQKRVPTEFVENFPMVTPSIEEQKQIVSYLNNETSKIDNTISKIKENIDLLEEYKNSLIHQVVTGKIDVRDEV